MCTCVLPQFLSGANNEPKIMSHTAKNFKFWCTLLSLFCVLSANVNVFAVIESFQMPYLSQLKNVCLLSEFTVKQCKSFISNSWWISWSRTMLKQPCWTFSCNIQNEYLSQWGPFPVMSLVLHLGKLWLSLHNTTCVRWLLFQACQVKCYTA